MGSVSQQPVWVIVGAAGTLGQAVTKHVMSLGHDCVAIDNNKQRLEALSDGLVNAGFSSPALYPIDLVGATLEQLGELAGAIEAAVGSIQHLVFAAGFFKAMRPLLHQPADEWLSMSQLGIHVPVFLTQQLRPLFDPMTTASMTWVIDPEPLEKPAHWGSYGMVQAARAWLAEALAQELGPKGPRVIAFKPPAFYSPISAQAWPARGQDEYTDVEEVAIELVEMALNGSENT